MTFERFLSEVERSRKTVAVYSSADEPDELDGFRTRNATVEYRRLPSEENGFAVVRDEEGFVGSIALEELRKLLEPPLCRPENVADLSPGYRALFEMLDGTLFSSLDRRQLLAASREIENRAWRVGEGTLRAGFQRLSVMKPQLDVYSALASDTDLEVHVYGEDDWTPPGIPGTVVHAIEDVPAVSEYWFLTFDGGGEAEQACALLAEERDCGEYLGFWTYDPELVGELEACVRVTFD